MIKKLRIKCNAKGQRGTEGAPELLDMVNENWSQIKENFKASSEEEQEGLLEHFNSAQDEMGDMLFGDDADYEDFKNKFNALSDEQQAAMITLINEVELFDTN